MSSRHRIRTIYGKELVDILRDRRTLIAMIVVPIVLYPLLMLGSIQAVSFQAEGLERATIRIGVVAEAQRLRLANMIINDTALLQRERSNVEPESEAYFSIPQPLDEAETVVVESREALEQGIRDRRIHVGVVFERERLIAVEDLDQQVRVELLSDLEEVRSSTAKRRVAGLMGRVNERMREQRFARLRLPPAFIEPFPIVTVDLSAPPSILGQVLPLILILMTITGAIYPAIDLTAGERERGTLESLMVCPVPTVDLIVGKFLVVTTVALMGALLNLGSVTATVYFGGFDKIIASTGGGVPVLKMVLILLCLVPFAVLMSAIMLAVCSYARTFKEAQNYVTPVILAVLIPGGIAALPATQLSGIMLVMPVGNMVLLARDLLLGAVVPVGTVATVLLSTTLYAGAAVAVAANIFGHESVVFSDAGSLRGLLSRRMIKPTDQPSISTGLLVVSLLFPMWFFVQSAFSPGPGEDASGLLAATGWLMPLMFVVLPMGVALYGKMRVWSTFAFRWPRFRYLAGGVLIGVSVWVPAHELNMLQHRLVAFPESLVKSSERLAETLSALPLGTVIVLIALIPALSEEVLFRGFLLGSLRTSARKWTAIVVSAAVFGVFHFFIYKFLVTAVLGVLLAYLCWQSRSILPGMVAHFLHNLLGAVSVVQPGWFERAGVSMEEAQAHLPGGLLVLGSGLFLVGLAIFVRGGGGPPVRGRGVIVPSTD